MQHAPRSPCPIATTLEIVGDRWTLVIIRDLVNGKSRFGEFLDSPERITTNILSDRLVTMARNGLIEKVARPNRPRQFSYQLTPKGRALLPILQDMCRWANRFAPDTWTPPQSFMKQRVG